MDRNPLGFDCFKSGVKSQNSEDALDAERFLVQKTVAAGQGAGGVGITCRRS